LEWFGSVVTATDLEEHKPHPAPVRRALEELDAEPGRSLFVGDSIHDLRSGRAAGTRTGAALWGPYDRERLAPAEPDLWLERPEELLEAVERMKREGRVG
ncbi:MAG TPA: HAD hydrolase-like protein, partial [Longimicrobiales bacterium]|nr:HAD hydrolase-like protein [Longimicrobiales bacterium]